MCTKMTLSFISKSSVRVSIDLYVPAHSLMWQWHEKQGKVQICNIPVFPCFHVCARGVCVYDPVYVMW